MIYLKPRDLADLSSG